MGILSDFFIAGGNGVPDYNGGQGFAPEDVCAAKRITPLEAGGMLAVLRGGDPVALTGEFKLVTPQEAEDWTMSVPQDMVDALAALEDAAIPAMSEKFAQATVEELGWSQADFEPLVNNLRALAKRAQDQGKTMYLWNCM